ncbi:hypothetical protein [Aureimonas leprariae]|uniref:Uncharacterized protein n=1 Tax=Plantimonas leprariae TaxID=2615207 RepID=A0A7V7PP76_9HYPH|nr:hypothetical protein [Aureimonas leprariae]KAB0679682.1 hypothetical protein F6X38_12760 [Aureimonas leprariae]
MTDDQLDAVIRQALAIRYGHAPVHAAAAAVALGVAVRTDLRLTHWTHETGGEWSAAMVGAADPREADADDDGSGRERPRLLLTVAPTTSGWRATVEKGLAVVPGGDMPPLADAIEDTISAAMARAARDAWMLVHRDPALAAGGCS